MHLFWDSKCCKTSDKYTEMAKLAINTQILQCYFYFCQKHMKNVLYFAVANVEKVAKLAISIQNRQNQRSTPIYFIATFASFFSQKYMKNVFFQGGNCGKTNDKYTDVSKLAIIGQILQRYFCHFFHFCKKYMKNVLYFGMANVAILAKNIQKWQNYQR